MIGSPYLPLAEGTRGIRRITGLTNIVSNGGLGCLVLVKPLIDITISSTNTPSEITLVSMKPGPPVIKDGAYLNYICNTLGSVAAGFLVGRTDFIWR